MRRQKYATDYPAVFTVGNSLRIAADSLEPSLLKNTINKTLSLAGSLSSVMRHVLLISTYNKVHEHAYLTHHIQMSLSILLGAFNM